MISSRIWTRVPAKVTKTKLRSDRSTSVLSHHYLNTFTITSSSNVANLEQLSLFFASKLCNKRQKSIFQPTNWLCNTISLVKIYNICWKKLFIRQDLNPQLFLYFDQHLDDGPLGTKLMRILRKYTWTA